MDRKEGDEIREEQKEHRHYAIQPMELQIGPVPELDLILIRFSDDEELYQVPGGTTVQELLDAREKRPEGWVRTPLEIIDLSLKDNTDA